MMIWECDSDSDPGLVIMSEMILSGIPSFPENSTLWFQKWLLDNETINEFYCKQLIFHNLTKRHFWVDTQKCWQNQWHVSWHKLELLQDSPAFSGNCSDSRDSNILITEHMKWQCQCIFFWQLSPQRASCQCTYWSPFNTKKFTSEWPWTEHKAFMPQESDDKLEQEPSASGRRKTELTLAGN